MKIIKRYRTYFLIVLSLIALLVLRSIVLRQPEERLTYTIHRAEMQEAIQISGDFTASSQTQVFSPTNGVISELYVSNQDIVEKGDALFHVESTATDEQKANAYAAYQQARTGLQTSQQSKDSSDASMWSKQKALIDAENNLNFMNERLAEAGDNPATKEPYTQLEIESIQSAVTKARKEFESAENQYKQIDQNIASAQSLVNSTKLAYDATRSKTVSSPANGRVVNLLKTVGDGVSSQDENKPILLVINQESPVIVAQVSEIDVARLKEGQVAKIIFDADKKSTFYGVLKAVDTVGQKNAGLTTYDVLIELTDFSSAIIKPGMTATITIETFSKKDVYTVPNSALVYQKDTAFLRKVKPEDELVEVDLGYQGLVETEIIGEAIDGLEIFVNNQAITP